MKRILLFFVSVVAFGTVAANAQSDKRVILIGSDGLSSEIIAKYPELFPNINNLFANGSSTLESRSVLPSSSAVNWASHLMGAGPELHGYTEWGSAKPDLPSRVLTDNGTFPCIVWSVRQKYPNDEIGVVYSWKTIDCLFDTIAASYYQFAQTDKEVCQKSIEYIKKNPRFAFFYFSDPDGPGHNNGWLSEEYKQSSHQVDKYVGEIVAAVNENMKNTTIIFISDHGGINKGHGGKSMAEMQVPFAIVGDGVKKGYKITDSQMVFDTAPTIANILDSPIPQVWIGRPVMSVFEYQEAQTIVPATSVKQIDEPEKVVGKSFNVALQENPTTGYQWQILSTHTTGSLEEKGSKYIPNANPSGLTGVGGVKQFMFKASKGSNVVIKLGYKRAWEASPIEVKTFKFKVK